MKRLGCGHSLFPFIFMKFPTSLVEDKGERASHQQSGNEIVTASGMEDLLDWVTEGVMKPSQTPHKHLSVALFEHLLSRFQIPTYTEECRKVRCVVGPNRDALFKRRVKCGILRGKSGGAIFGGPKPFQSPPCITSFWPPRHRCYYSRSFSRPISSNTIIS